MAPQVRRYFEAVKGITDGASHMVPGSVFAATPTLLDHFDRTGGVDDDEVTVFYKPSTRAEYDAYLLSIADPEAPPAPVPTPVVRPIVSSVPSEGVVSNA